MLYASLRETFKNTKRLRQRFKRTNSTEDYLIFSDYMKEYKSKLAVILSTSYKFNQVYNRISNYFGHIEKQNGEQTAIRLNSNLTIAYVTFNGNRLLPFEPNSS